MTEVDITPGAQAVAEELRTLTAAHGDAIKQQLGMIAAVPLILGADEASRMVAKGVEAARPLAEVTGKLAAVAEQDGALGEVFVGRLVEVDRRFPRMLHT
ncbi:hypothetical protein GCM10010399_71530 [Dactylosporangium fulvum]|uniref:Uncharacterized protein n=1 Tax=Dactylosporangium fulvum TaxID=53359 RepID=A0ABY5VYQ7_9ACTN|nr:hypothetical protein [Dactylosporangium fulvum]UWP82174.1 hypothetical protein Dfulv_45110 [Dactylosporangium fulvum]